MSESTTHFGYRDVPESEKSKLVGEVFTSVATKYDVMNDLMSFGAHRVWKRYFVATSGVREGDIVLDLAGGTGDIAALLLPRVGDKGAVVVGDINADMLRVGRDRLLDRGRVRGLDYAQLDAEALPFPDKIVRLRDDGVRPSQRDAQGARARRDPSRAEDRRTRADPRVLARARGIPEAALRLPFVPGAAAPRQARSPATRRATAISPSRSASIRIRTR